METRFSKRSGRAAATMELAVFLVLVGREAGAQNYPVLPVVPDHVYVTRGGGLRQGDLFTIEPSFLFLPGGRDGSFVVVGRPMLGLGGSGMGIGIAPIWVNKESPTPNLDRHEQFPILDRL